MHKYGNSEQITAEKHQQGVLHVDDSVSSERWIEIDELSVREDMRGWVKELAQRQQLAKQEEASLKNTRVKDTTKWVGKIILLLNEKKSTWSNIAPNSI